MAFGFDVLIENLQHIGFYNFFLPFVLILAIVYGIMKQYEILGQDDSVIAVASVAVAFLALGGTFLFVPHNFFPQFFGALAVILVGLLGLAILLGFFGINLQDMGKDWGWKWSLPLLLILAALVITLITQYIFQVNIWVSVVGAIEQIFQSPVVVDTLVTILMILALIGAIWFVIREGGSQ